ncbi:MAG: OmpA family protein [Saprospiraceae bacterium]|nr:OmpA family protein [Saprospiraceae bacterium]
MSKEFIHCVQYACYFFIFNLNVVGQQNLILNSDFENLETYQIKTLNINGQFVGKNFEADSIFSLSDQSCEPVISKFWRFQDAPIKSFNAIYSNINLCYNGFVCGRIYPFHQSGEKEFVVRNLVGEFCKTLVKDNYYELTIWIKPYTGNTYADSIGVMLSEELIDKKNYFDYDSKETQGNYTNGFKLDKDDLSNFSKYTLRLKANGGEKYIIIGNPNFAIPKIKKILNSHFYGINRTSYIHPKPSCSYLIDNIEFKNITDFNDSCTFINYAMSATETLDTIKSENFDISTDSKDTTMIFEIYFETAKSNFDQNKLVEIIKEINNLMVVNKITIIGNTDENGDNNYNLSLSEKRALSVKNSLEKYISNVHISTNYEGERNSVYDLDEKNRRVQLIFFGKKL